jgi:hypothetical protein
VSDLSEAGRDLFDHVLSVVASRGGGMSLPDLAAAHALARELDGPEPDPGTLRELFRRLRIRPADLEPDPDQEPRGEPGPVLDLFPEDPAA